MEHDKEFLDISKGMVSNDNSVREESLDKMKNYVKEEIKNKEVFEFIFLKIWKSMFYFFWNSDKSFRQKAQAEKIANFFDYIEESEIDKYHIWIKCFLLEFIKKWPKIDFLRLDKYIMLLQTIIRKYFDFNLKNNKFSDALRIFDYIVLSIKSGFYNYNFVSNVLNNIGYIIDQFFKDDSFKNSPNNEFFSSFTDKLISLFLTIRDKREIKNFKENLFNRIDSIMINDPFYRDSELKKLYQKKIFEKATSKEELPEPQRSLLFKVYKKVKYLDENYEEKEKEKVKTYDVDPVNDYILKKVYSNRTRMTKIERMRLLANKRRFQESNQKQLTQMEKEKMDKLTNEINKEFSQKENKAGEKKIDLELNSDKNLNSNKSNNIKAENNIKNKENIGSNKNQEKENKNNNPKSKNKLNDSVNDIKHSKDLTNNDTFCSEKETTKSPKIEAKKEELLEENIIKLDESNEESKPKKEKSSKQTHKKIQKDSDSEDMELEEDNDFEDSIEKSSQEDIENEKKSNLLAEEDEEEEDEEEDEGEELEDAEEPLDYDEELEYYDGEDGEEYEFEDEGELMENEEMDFMDEDEEYEEMDSEEEEYYEKLYGKSLGNIYSKIQGKSAKEKSKNIQPKSQEEIEMQKSLIIARNNSIKNAMLKTSSNNFLLGKKRNKGLLNGSNNQEKNNLNSKPNNGSSENQNIKNANPKKANGHSGPKKKVNFTLSKNTVNNYEQLKPIILTSKTRVVPNGSPAKGALKQKSKLN